VVECHIAVGRIFDAVRVGTERPKTGRRVVRAAGVGIERLIAKRDILSAAHKGKERLKTVSRIIATGDPTVPGIGPKLIAGRGICPGHQRHEGEEDPPGLQSLCSIPWTLRAPACAVDSLDEQTTDHGTHYFLRLAQYRVGLFVGERWNGERHNGNHTNIADRDGLRPTVPPMTCVSDHNGDVDFINRHCIFTEVVHKLIRPAQAQLLPP